MCDGSGYIYDKETNTFKFCKCYELQIAQSKLKFANIPEEFKDLKVNDFDTEIYTDENDKMLARVAKKAVVNYIKKFDTTYKIGKGLYFYSNAKGSGKTRLMASLGNAVIKKHMKSVKFTTTNNLLDEIRNTFKSDTYSKLVEEIKRSDILILDDFGTERPTEWVSEMFYSILNDRMTSKRITMFTSNYSIENLKYDDRIISRVEKMAMPVKFPEQSVRTVLAKKENENLMKFLMEA